MQALIIRDNFDDATMTQALYNHLEGFNIIEIKSFRELNAAKILLDPNSPCLIYHNIFMRLDNPKEIWEFHKRNIFNNTIKIGCEIVSVLPRAINNYERDINALVYLNPEFTITNKIISYVNSGKKPVCFMATHNRDVYLQLTLNSLFFATQNIDLKIILNNPTEKVKKVALSFAEKYSNIELFQTENSFISATNLMLQWHNPEKFIYIEDDMLFPPSTKLFFPDFCHQFISRLDYFDLCLWKVVTDNSNAHLAHKRNTFEFLESEWEIWEPNSKHILMAQCIAMKSKFYIEAIKKYINLDPNVKKYYAPYDSHLIQQAHAICHPSIRGYHIGWNQEMDGFAKLIDGSRHPNLASYKFKVENINTNEIREIDLRDLI